MFPLIFAAAAVATGAFIGSRVEHDHYAHIELDGSRIMREALEKIRAAEILEDIQHQFRDLTTDLRANSDHLVANVEKTSAALLKDMHTLVVALVVLITVLIAYIVWCAILRGMAEARERRTARVRLAFYDNGKFVLCEAKGTDPRLLQMSYGS